MTKNSMKKIFLMLIDMTMLIVACNQNGKVQQNNSKNEDAEMSSAEVGTVQSFLMDDPDTIQSFLGKPIVMNDSIFEQIAVIADQDNMLSFSYHDTHTNHGILKIGDVGWGVNIGPYITLFSSVQPDDPKMKQVIKYLNGIYGKPYEDEEDGYDIKWSSSDDSLDLFRPGSTLVHLRRVHSEEGGTFLFFQ